MSASLGQLAKRLDQVARVVDGHDKTMLTAAGNAGKSAALTAARADTGGDLALSGMRRKVRLGAGYDIASTSVTVNLRPGGLWKLLAEGRHKTKVVRRTQRTRKRGPYNTPYGPRWGFTSSPSKGSDTIDKAVQRMRREVAPAAHNAMVRELGRVF